jgi:hypothetical protein
MINDEVYQRQLNALRLAPDLETLNAEFHAATAIWYAEADISAEVRRAALDILLEVRGNRVKFLEARDHSHDTISSDGSLDSLQKALTLADFDKAMAAIMAKGFGNRPVKTRVLLLEYYLSGRERRWKTG